MIDRYARRRINNISTRALNQETQIRHINNVLWPHQSESMERQIDDLTDKVKVLERSSEIALECRGGLRHRIRNLANIVKINNGKCDARAEGVADLTERVEALEKQQRFSYIDPDNPEPDPYPVEIVGDCVGDFIEPSEYIDKLKGSWICQECGVIAEEDVCHPNSSKPDGEWHWVKNIIAKTDSWHYIKWIPAIVEDATEAVPVNPYSEALKKACEEKIVEDATEPVIISRYEPPPEVPERELLPCPFCGGEPSLREYYPHVDSIETLWAIGCCAEIQEEATEGDAVLAWNRRNTTEIDRLTAELGERNKQLNIEEGRVMILKAENERLLKKWGELRDTNDSSMRYSEQTIKRYKEAIEAAVDTLHSTGGANTLLYRNLQETLSDNE